jgi:hypothetical protein
MTADIGWNGTTMRSTEVTGLNPSWLSSQGRISLDGQRDTKKRRLLRTQLHKDLNQALPQPGKGLNLLALSYNLLQLRRIKKKVSWT